MNETNEIMTLQQAIAKLVTALRSYAASKTARVGVVMKGHYDLPEHESIETVKQVSARVKQEQVAAADLADEFEAAGDDAAKIKSALHMLSTHTDLPQDWASVVVGIMHGNKYSPEGWQYM